MRASLPHGVTYDDDELLNILDMIWDYYEQNGLLDIDTISDDEEDDNMLNDLVDYCKRMLRKDKDATFDASHLPDVIQAELEYEQSLDEL